MKVKFRCEKIISINVNFNVDFFQNVVICNQYVKCVNLMKKSCYVFFFDDVNFNHLIVFVIWCFCIVFLNTQKCFDFFFNKKLNRHVDWFQLIFWLIDIDFARSSTSISHVHWHQSTRRLTSINFLINRHRFRTFIDINFTRSLTLTDFLINWFKKIHEIRADENVHFFLNVWSRRQLNFLILDFKQRCTHRR